MCHYDDPDLLTCQSCRTPYSDPSTWEVMTHCAAFLAGPRVLLRCSEEPTFPGQSLGVTPEGDLCRRCTMIKNAREADLENNSNSSSGDGTPEADPAATQDGASPAPTRKKERLERLKRMGTARTARWAAHGMAHAHAGRPVNADGPLGEDSECVPHSCPFARRCRYGCASMRARLKAQQMENMLLPRGRPEDLVDGDGAGGDEVPRVPRCPFTYYCPINCMGMYLRKLE
ncbi:uncharacterized protein PpBr36_09526 [Pyricularia pennisetigena]|uniref:uncharacterized protein n=1 Tax=Pyricularia pennisetigena TaxID=1578925 RepID=UPI001151C73F|nr:uncharacterized protein PpBr36_09526 [Pyricularia pennisetigena]TLS21829.1 hypothetical protein PpBr36_09526 [Pyricularia pennisetigena]